MTATRPKWNDEEAVAAYVNRLIQEADDEEERQHYMRDWSSVPGIPMSELWESMERDAVAQAERGNFRKLADLIDGGGDPDLILPNGHPLPPNPLIVELKSMGCRLGLRSEALIAGYLRGRRGRRGRPKQTIEERRSSTRVHDAAAELKEIQDILRNNYLGERDLRERAIAIAADRAKIKYGTLKNYLRSRRRLP
jgi:hypothetical protein